MEKEVDVKISQNWGQDEAGAREHIKKMSKILEPLKEEGMLDFKAFLTRKCDFCGKSLQEGDKFETIGDLDKCEECKIGER